MEKNSRIYVAGSTGLVGSAIVRTLKNKGYAQIITSTRAELNLCDAQATAHFFAQEKPEYVFNAAARVGGILANKNHKANMLLDNLRIQTNLMESAYHSQVKKFLFLGSSCIYPKFAQQPIVESEMLNGHLEPTNDAYAIAKITGIMLCRAFREQYGFNAIAAMPCNVYGVWDNFHPNNSHLLPGIVRKMHEAKANNQPAVVLWGTGQPKREMINSDDLADACEFLMLHYNDAEHINVGWGIDYRIAEIAEIAKSVVGYQGAIQYDDSKPDGTPRKVLNVDKLKSLGWEAKIPLKQGCHTLYQSFLNGEFHER